MQNVANILILQEDPSWQDSLRNCLQSYHLLEIVRDSRVAISRLQEQHFDLVITLVHFKSNDMFEFLRQLKEEPRTSKIPVICFCGLRTRTANLANDAVKQASYILGASKFLSVEEFCTTSDTCDLARMRTEIESVLRQRVN